MKVIKAFCLVLFAFFAFEMSGQSIYADNAYVKNSISNLKTQLEKGGSKETLSEAQMVKLEKVFALKQPKFNKIISSGLEKGDMSKEMSKLDAEFAAQIEAVLSSDQKMAFKSQSTAKLRN
ncbi:MAG: hypothetical protein IPN29_04510 [Saprospiraceae bacterium]|nr:hypothetical protein [Saprospiraceae bacterium]